MNLLRTSHTYSVSFNLRSLKLLPTKTAFSALVIIQFSSSASHVARSRYVRLNDTRFDSLDSSSTSSNPLRMCTGPSGSPGDRYFSKVSSKAQALGRASTYQLSNLRPVPLARVLNADGYRIQDLVQPRIASRIVASGMSRSRLAVQARLGNTFFLLKLLLPLFDSRIDVPLTGSKSSGITASSLSPISPSTGASPASPSAASVRRLPTRSSSNSEYS